MQAHWPPSSAASTRSKSGLALEPCCRWASQASCALRTASSVQIPFLPHNQQRDLSLGQAWASIHHARSKEHAIQHTAQGLCSVLSQCLLWCRSGRFACCRSCWIHSSASVQAAAQLFARHTLCVEALLRRLQLCDLLRQLPLTPGSISAGRSDAHLRVQAAAQGQAAAAQPFIRHPPFAEVLLSRPQQLYELLRQLPLTSGSSTLPGWCAPELCRTRMMSNKCIEQSLGLARMMPAHRSCTAYSGSCHSHQAAAHSPAGAL